MNELPTGWASAEVKDLASIKLGKMLDKTKNKGEPQPYLRNINVRWGEFDLSDILTMRFTEDELATFEIRDGDLLVCEGGEPGRCAVWKNGPTEFKYQKALLRARFPDGVDPNLVVLYMRLLADSGQLQDHFTGTTIKHLPHAAFERIKVPLPPQREQHRIVAKLDRLRARSARARHELDHIPKLIERYKQAILAKAFSGELTKDWRAVRSELPAPTDSTVGAISEITSGVGFPKNRQGRASGDYPFAKVSDISRAVARENGQLSTAANFVDEVDLASLRANPVPAGSTVFAKIGEALRLNRRALTAVPLILDNNCMALTPNTRQVRPAYLYFFMQTVDLSPFAVATAVPSVRRGDVANLELLLPSLDEQDEILRRMGLALAWLDKIATEHARAEHLLPKLDQAILAKAFRGELVPQDPNDEPASVLLERIKTERGGSQTIGATSRRGRRRSLHE